MMLYRYETHLHTAEVSPCASTGAAEMVGAFHRVGFTGVIVTDHFLTESPEEYQGLSWPIQVERFMSGYRLARKTGEALGVQVFFGWEMTSHPRCEDFLVYGLDEAFLLQHPEVTSLPIEDFCTLARQSGGLVIRAHPYRKAPYIAFPAQIDPDIIDGIEVNNGRSDDPENFNPKAWAYARSHPALLRTAGTDIHDAAFAGVSGMAFPYPLKDIGHFIGALRAGDGLLIIDGQVTDREGRLI